MPWAEPHRQHFCVELLKILNKINFDLDLYHFNYFNINEQFRVRIIIRKM